LLRRPPRAWGRLGASSWSHSHVRNTTTGVGKTVILLIYGGAIGKHPHGRGEDIGFTVIHEDGSETPPRAWGRPEIHEKVGTSEGNTPTGVGKTRGAALAVAVSGNTPTGVGKTVASAAASGLGRKHPHGRGEDSPCGASSPDRCETPPRAWGRPHAALHSSIKCRNTPTGVGKTFTASSVLRCTKKHPTGVGKTSPPYGRPTI